MMYLTVAAVGIVTMAIMAGCGGGGGPQGAQEMARAMELRSISCEYLVRHLGSIPDNGTMFCACRLLGKREDGDTITLYLWAFLQEYALHDGGIAAGSGISAPIALQLYNGGMDRPLVLGYRMPGDGSRFASDAKDIFPHELLDVVLAKDAASHAGMVQQLEQETLIDALHYFNGKASSGQVLL